MSTPIDGNGQVMRRPKTTTYKGVYKRRKEEKTDEKALKVLGLTRNQMTMRQILDIYQDSVLCESTREAKKNGAWYVRDYCWGQEDDISTVGENTVFEACKLKRG